MLVLFAVVFFIAWLVMALVMKVGGLLAHGLLVVALIAVYAAKKQRSLPQGGSTSISGR